MIVSCSNLRRSNAPPTAPPVSSTQFGQTPLLVAAAHSSVTMMHKLLDAGADLLACDKTVRLSVCPPVRCTASSVRRSREGGSGGD